MDINTIQTLCDAQKQGGKKNQVIRKNGMTHFRLPHYKALKTQDPLFSSLWGPLNTAPMISASCHLWLFAVPSCTVQVGLCDQYNMAEVMVCDYMHTPYAFLLHDFAHVFPSSGGKIPIPFLSSFFKVHSNCQRLSPRHNTNSNLPSLMTLYCLLAIPFTHTKVF